MTDAMYRKFEVDQIFNQSTLNVEIFEFCVKKYVNKFLEGKNSSVFAYGQTGTGE